MHHTRAPGTYLFHARVGMSAILASDQARWFCSSLSSAIVHPLFALRNRLLVPNPKP